MNEEKVRRVAVGVDFGQPSIRAARWAARAFGRGIDLLLVHCLDTREPPPFLRSDVRPLEERIAVERAEARVRLERLAESLPPDPVSFRIRQGRAAEELAAVAAEDEADLVVVGEHGPRRGVRGSVGSSGSQLPMISPVPVLVKRHLPERHPRRVLAAIDPSGAGDSVLEWTRVLSRYQRRPHEVTIHMSVEPEWSELAARSIAEDRHRDAATGLSAAHQWLSERARAAGLEDARIDVSTGDPRYEILAVQRRNVIDLVVVGRRGGGTAASPVIGSVANTVLQAAFCSVLVV